MKYVTSGIAMLSLTIAFGVLVTAAVFAKDVKSTKRAAEEATAQPEPAAVKRAQKLVKELDNIFKQTIVLITDKYVHDEEDFAAGSAAVLLFETISEGGDNKVRLLDVTGEPYDPENVAQDAFEKEGVSRLKKGAAGYEQVVEKEGLSYLRSMTPVPVVMQKCVMCHPHYEGVKKGAPIGAISYTVPID
ncbi:c-type heme family protein [Rubinisphaera margarita]|uniref:c-type heme family protein n=1 Tax=Rubinisphaera margarita TaxID=2909586 RepID=UPI001EE889F1|nr:DUF3365 domain-containing protein [Rubinisphaera margarita]MCG6158101.1 DUF3365 domain-containing protein [Rubinisphaera margarita]